MADDDDDTKKDGRKTADRRFSDDAIDNAKQELFGGVGYKKPPRHTQFQKGQSGNPKGRPRGIAQDLSMAEQPTLEAVLKSLGREITVKENGRETQIPIRRAIVQSIIATALKGNARSQGLAIDLARTAEQAHAREVMQQNEIWSFIKAERQSELDEAIELGRPTRHILPHPDDIIIDHVNMPKIIGPVHPDELARCEETIAFCEVLLMQNELDERSPVRLNGEPLDEPGSALLVFHLLQRSLPPRLRMSMGDITYRMGGHQAKSKRLLLKELHQAWRKLGKSISRGYVFPNLRIMRKQVEFILEFTQEFEAGQIDLNAMARGEFDECIIEIMEKYGLEAA